MDIFLAHNTLWTLRGGQWLLQMAVSYFSNNIQEITLIFTLDEVTSLDLFKNFSFRVTWNISIRNTVFLFGFPERYCPSSAHQRQVPGGLAVEAYHRAYFNHH